MKIIRTFHGFCPTLEKDYSVDVEYVDASTMGNENYYIQGLIDCHHNSLNACPVFSDCPIIAKAPKEITL